MSIGARLILVIENAKGESGNSAVEYYCEIGESDDRLRSQLDLFVAMTSQRVFDRLRTKETLGYIVFSGVCSTQAVLGYRILVQSEKDPIVIEKRIEALLVELEGFLSSITDEQFNQFKSAAIHKQTQEPQDLLHEGDIVWEAISSRRYDFDKGDFHAYFNIDPSKRYSR